MGTLVAILAMAGAVSSAGMHPLRAQFYEVDPYGLDRFRASEYNYCVSGCNASYSTCLMSYVSFPSPHAYCRRIQVVCARRCP